MATRTLFEISDDLLELDALLDGIEDDEDQREAIDQYLQSIEGELSGKLDNYAAYITELDARSEARKAEANRILHRSKMDANRATRLKECLRWFFFTHRMKVYETPRYRVTLAANGGKLPVLLSVPEEQLPADYVREIVSYKADLDLIREALESGIEVEGASLGERGSSIRIR